MNEVLSILIALTALIVGLLGIGWAFGDYQRPPGPPPQPGSSQKPGAL